uniref:Uncharacterized protein n=1 Tax=Anguilla anguilla TaxID=7936 RepID=A0A0E9SR97_ANGAN
MYRKEGIIFYYTRGLKLSYISVPLL